MKLAVATGVALAGCSLFAAIQVKVEQDRESALYACGETASFKVAVVDEAGRPVGTGSARWKLDNFGTVVIGKGNADLSTGNPFTVKGGLDEPGFLRLTVWSGTNSVVWSVGFDVLKIRQDEPRPADFDAYWAGEKARLEREVPLNPSCEKVDRLCRREWSCYKIGFDTFNGKRLWGFMTVPTKGRPPYRCRIRICDAGPGAIAPWEANADEVTATLSVYDFEPGKDAEEQKKRLDQMNARLREKYGLPASATYRTAGLGTSREDYFFHDAMLGLNRAVDWLAKRPEVDPKRIVYFGSSQGGGFGLFVNYLNANFSRAVFAVPAITGHYGFRKKRMNGWPNLVDGQPAAQRAAAERYAAYFDGVNFAVGIRHPVRFIVGFSDTTCPPPDVYSAFNVCPSSDKAIVNCVGAGHCSFNAWIRENRGKPSWLDYNAWLRMCDPVSHVSAAVARGEKSVTVPKGIYEVSPTGDETAYFRLRGLKDVTIDFCGSELIGLVKTRMFDIADCTNLTIRNVALDFKDLPFTQAVIEKTDEEGNWDVRVISGYPRPDVTEKTLAIDSHDDFWPIQAYDGKTFELKNRMRYLDHVAIRRTGSDTYRITGGRDRRGDVGDIAVWSVKERGRNVVGENVNAVRCGNLVFEDVVQYATPHGRAFIDWESEATVYRRCKVIRRPPETDPVRRGLKRLRSGNHDAFISKNAYVGPQLTGCVAEYHCDDCVNVSGGYQIVYEGKGDAVRVFVHGVWDLQISPGDPCQVLTPDGRILPDVRVLSIEPGPEIRRAESSYLETIGLWPGIASAMRKSYVLKLDRAVDFPRGTALASGNRLGNGFVIRDCRFGSTRARGLLLKACHGLVENCDVQEAVCLTTEYEWLSAGIAHDVVFRNNRFAKPLCLGGRAAHNKLLPEGVNRGIVIE